MTRKGNYYLPLSDASQITIDCSSIPVVELADGSIILLDFSDRLSEEVREIVRHYSDGYSFVPAEELKTPLSSLGGLINRSKGFAFYDRQGEVKVSSSPAVAIFPDAIIETKTKSAGGPARLFLFLRGEGDHPLPGGLLAFLQKIGVQTLEIYPGVKARPPARSSPSSPLSARRFKGIDLAELLLTAVGEKPKRGVSVTIFDQVRDGFNLSLAADLVVEKGDRRIIYHFKKLPEQFLRILKGHGAEVILVSEGDKGKALAEKVLSPLSFKISSVDRSLHFPLEGQPRVSVFLKALEVAGEGGPLCLLCEEDIGELLPILTGHFKVPIISY
jgi:hypothetical protein